jgi:two-component system response regulator HydG
LTWRRRSRTISETPERQLAKILYVDDDLAAAALKKEILEQAGYLITVCSSAEDAIQELERSRYDAVITDWRLGQSRGRAIVQAARSVSTMPVVVVSGFVGEAFQSAEPPADIYLEKPVDSRELVQILKTLLEVKAEGKSQARP